MSAEATYEKDWQVCPECGHRRPAKVLVDGKCADDWHRKLMAATRERAEVGT